MQPRCERRRQHLCAPAPHPPTPNHPPATQNEHPWGCRHCPRTGRANPPSLGPRRLRPPDKRAAPRVFLLFRGVFWDSRGTPGAVRGGCPGWGLTLVFGSRHFQVCRALGFAVHPPPACAQDGPAAPSRSPRSLPLGSASKETPARAPPHARAAPQAPTGSGGDLTARRRRRRRRPQPPPAALRGLGVAKGEGGCTGGGFTAILGGS